MDKSILDLPGGWTKITVLRLAGRGKIATGKSFKQIQIPGPRLRSIETESP